MKKLLESRRWVGLSLVLFLAVSGLFWVNPPSPGRAFFKKADVVDTAPVTNAEHTPDDLLW
jgi:hypothetical protein